MVRIQASRTLAGDTFMVCTSEVHGVLMTFELIWEANSLFRPPSQSHDNVIDHDDVEATQSSSLGYCPHMYENGEGLAHKTGIFKIQILSSCLQEWPSIVYITVSQVCEILVL